jgi:uncharacterized protein (DUF305 family)
MIKHTLLVLGTTLALALPAAAQDAMATATADLPDICKPAMHHDMGSMKMDMTGMDEAHQDLAMGMDETNAQMMQGMMASDIDVAFVCAMIPHHQAAINMAKAELKHGDSDWAKQMAQKVIDAQQKEIEEMLNWLSEQK